MIKLMIVEDDPMVAELNKRYVDTIEGYCLVSIARNGEEALRYLEVKEVDLILLDVYMPRLNGLELLRHIRKKEIWVDVILVTASKESDSINELLKLGAVDYLIKPFSYERLKEALENYRSRYELFSQSREVTQDEIDKITKFSQSDNNSSLPKGLHKHTLESIREYLDIDSSFCLLFYNRGKLFTC